jgi:glutaredoxin
MRVVVYGAEWCEPCRKVKEELEVADVPYVFRDIDANLVAKQHAWSVQKTIPLVEIEGNSGNRVVIGGYEDTKDVLDILQFIAQEV